MSIKHAIVNKVVKDKINNKLKDGITEAINNSNLEPVKEWFNHDLNV